MSDVQQPLIGPRLVVGLLLISALSLLAFFALSAYAPDLRSEETGSANALSKSAIGFAGIRSLVADAATPAELRRDPSPCVACSLLVLTPEMTDDSNSLPSLVHSSPVLIILPKWVTTPKPLQPGWVMKIDSLPITAIANVVSALVPDAKIAQRSNMSQVMLKAKDSRFAATIPATLTSVDKLQTVSGKNLEPKIVDDSGAAVLSQLRGTQIYILADPDFANNQAISRLSTARLAYGVMQLIRAGKRPVEFDLTLNGFRRAPDLLRAIFSPPFLGATLCAILAAAFIALHALSRFGAPRRTDRAFAFGKRALADNTAAVIRLMRREPRMASRYAQATLRLVGMQVGATRERLLQPQWIETLEKRAEAPYRFAELNSEASMVRDTSDLVKVAEKLYRWRRGILHEH